MTEFFKALERFKPRPKKQFYIKVEGEKVIHIGHTNIENSIEIDSESYGKLHQGGLENYTWNGSTILRRPVVKLKPLEDELLPTDEKGYKFLQGNPYWPETFVDKGEGIYTWQKK
jgi:hypothetical protein